MIYDEGFALELGEMSFFSFSNYKRSDPNDKSKFDSMCYSTTVGWYRNRDSTKWGCYKATKLGVDPDTVTTHDTKNNMVVVENKVEDSSKGQLFDYFRFKHNEIENLNPLLGKRQGKLLRKEYDPNENRLLSFLSIQDKVKDRHKLFAQLRLTSKFKNHSKYIEQLNSIKKSWVAEVPQNFNGLTIGQLNLMAGRKKEFSYRFKSLETAQNIIQ